jgi:hypothetical protein
MLFIFQQDFRHKTTSAIKSTHWEKIASTAWSELYNKFYPDSIKTYIPVFFLYKFCSHLQRKQYETKHKNIPLKKSKIRQIFKKSMYSKWSEYTIKSINRFWCRHLPWATCIIQVCTSIQNIHVQSNLY